MVAFGRRDAPLVRPVEADGVELALQRRDFGGRVVDRLLIGVDFSREWTHDVLPRVRLSLLVSRCDVPAQSTGTITPAKLINQVNARGNWMRRGSREPTPISRRSTTRPPKSRRCSASSTPSRFDGTNKRRITTAEGNHRINMSPAATYFIDRYSFRAPTGAGGTLVGAGPEDRTLEGNASVTNWLTTHAYSPAEIFSFTTSDGVHIDANMVKPVPFDPNKRYPVIFDVYGRPGSQAGL